jgi:DNA repair protein SbcD/Mre11
VALGHLHRSQSVAGPCPIWYCGSPLQLDFGETDNESSVLLVEARPGVPATVEQRPLMSGRRLRTLRGTMADLTDLVDKAGDDYLRVYVREPARIGLADDVRQLFPEAVDVIVDAATQGDDHKPEVRREGRSPHELFVEYLGERGESDSRLVGLFDELYEVTSAAD